MMTGHASGADRAYYDQREAQERAAADNTQEDVARRVHLELADRYAALREKQPA